MKIKQRVAPACRDKRYYPDECTARAGAMLAVELDPIKTELWIYKCRECRGWHLTKRRQGRTYKVTADEPVHAPAH